MLPLRSRLTCTPPRHLLQARHSLSALLLEQQAHLPLAATHSAPTVPLRQSALRLRSRGRVSLAWTVLCSPRPQPRHHSSRKQAAISLRSPWMTMTRSCDYGLSMSRDFTIANRDVLSSPRMERVDSKGLPDDAQRTDRAQRAQSTPIDGLDYGERYASHSSRYSARTASTEHSLWKDPDLEGRL
jgi:hypothetical protein